MLSARGPCDELAPRPGNPTDCGASLCVTSKPHELGVRIKQAEPLGDAWGK